MANTSETPRTKLMRQVQMMLGEGIIRVGLKPEHVDLAVEMALDIYRARSSNSVTEYYAFLELQPGQSDYYLEDVQNVVKILRAGVGGIGNGGGTSFDPFGAAFVNQTTTGLGSAKSGGLLTYYLYTDYVSTVGKLFGAEISFIFESSTHKLNIARAPRGKETVLLHVYKKRSDNDIITDTYVGPWIRDYAIARSKVIIGEARGKFGNIVGPQGGSSMNGAEMKAEGTAEMERLINELKNGVDQDIGYGFIIG